MLVQLLLPLFCRCSGAVAMIVLLPCGSAATPLDMSVICFLSVRMVLGKSPLLGDVSPHLEVERGTHLLRKL